MADLTCAVWRKSSRSNNGGQCVEVADNDGLLVGQGVVGLRDSKDPQGPAMAFAPTAWAAFVSGLKTGEFEL